MVIVITALMRMILSGTDIAHRSSVEFPLGFTCVFRGCGPLRAYDLLLLLLLVVVVVVLVVVVVIVWLVSLSLLIIRITTITISMTINCIIVQDL